MTSNPGRIVAGLAAIGAVLATAGAASAAPEAAINVEIAFTFQDERIIESSGLALGANDVVWTVNDSGDAPRIYGVDRDGCTRVDLLMAGVEVRDVEDLAFTRTDGAGTLVVADVGDNRAVRTTTAIHRVPEPEIDTDVPCPSEPDVITVTPTTTTVVMPEPVDVEAMIVDSVSGETLLVSKSPLGATEVFRIPESGRAESVAVLSRDTGVSTVTGGDAKADGSQIILRSYSRAWVFGVGDDWPSTFAEPLREFALPVQPQGEAITWDLDGWLISSEDPLGTRSPVLSITSDDRAVADLPLADPTLEPPIGGDPPLLQDPVVPLTPGQSDVVEPVTDRQEEPRQQLEDERGGDVVVKRLAIIATAVLGVGGVIALRRRRGRSRV